ncbi:MAG: NAD-dependent epimerase/dehydratase family protein [Lachnospiraceae bacterium]|nr:NAD-dependent epimerase/dehydratase family protein [Lachnospiraceae bacterium]
MKKCLITGEKSYIGLNLKDYLMGPDFKGMYEVDCISLRGENWKQASFAGTDTVFHMAGKAHVDISTLTKEGQQEYYDINCKLAVETAKKAKADGVSQFVYMSSVIIFGDSAPVGKTKRISADTNPEPSNFYGDSKLQAEMQLMELNDESFHVAIVRAPMIYGYLSKGNFPLLTKIAMKLPVFPSISNERSMLYIENLTEFLRILGESGEGGYFYPQNKEFVSTAEMVKEIAASNGKKIRLWGMLNPFVRLAAKVPGKIGNMADKAFGNLSIEQSLSKYSFGEYAKYDMKESIRRIYK